MSFPPPKPTNAPQEAMPLHLSRVQSGFASPIDDYREHGLDLHSLPTIMDGDLDKLIDALSNSYQAELLAALSDDEP